MRAGRWKHSNSSLRFGLLFALVLAGNVAALAERLPVKSYTSADGLSTSAIFDITHDARGFLWISTRDGLIRFDGYRFVTYRFGGSDAEPAIYSVLATRAGVYWINLNRGTDYRFVPPVDASAAGPVGPTQPQDDQRLLLAAEPIIDTPVPTYEDRAGNLWAGDATGLYLMREVDGKLVARHIALNLSGNPDKGIGYVTFYDGENGLWIGTDWGLVRRLPDGKIIHYNIRPGDNGDSLVSLAEDRDGRVWITRPDGVVVLKPEPFSSLAGLGEFTRRKLVIRVGLVAADGQPQLPQIGGEAVAFASADFLQLDAVRRAQEQSFPKPIIYKLLRASDDRIWISTSRGLVVFDGHQLRRYTTDQGLNRANGIAEDNEGNIWIGGNGGLMRLNPKGLITWDSTEGLGDPAVASIYGDRNGTLHVIGSSFAISRLTNATFIRTHPLLPTGSTSIWLSNVALVDSHGELWIATQQKLYRYSGISSIEEVSRNRPIASYSRRDGLSGDAIYRIFEDSRGDLWISTRRAGAGDNQLGLTRWARATATFHKFSEAEGFPSNVSPSAFAEDRNGTLWLGLTEGGLARYKYGRFAVFSEQEGIPAGTVTDLHVDRSGRLWLASSRGGLGRLDDLTARLPGFKFYTLADGLSSNNVRCITEDLFGNIYVGTVNGVNRLSPDTGRVRYYGVADGLAGDFVTVAYRDPQGALWFGTYNGVSKLVPEPDSPSPPPPILIGGLRIAGRDYAVSPLGQSEIVGPELSANQNDLEIDYSSISVGAAALLRYQYKLEGADSEWSPATAQRSISYASLSPGAYRFVVRAIGADGTISARPATISFRILRPVWQRWWFVTLAALFALAAATTLYNYRVRRLLELERVRTRIATDLHDDIGSSLSQIAILSEVVRQKVGQDHAAVTEPLSQITTSSSELMDTMSDIVWAIDPHKDRLTDLTQRMRRFASDVLTSRNIDFDFNEPDAHHNLNLGADVRRQIFLVCKESINNIVRHSHCTQVYIEFRVNRDSLSLIIKDNGRGFDTAHESDGHGLLSMEQRAKETGGTLQITSQPGEGTVITLTMPIRGRPKLRRIS